MSQEITRRRFLQAGAAVLAVAALTACGGSGDAPAPTPTPDPSSKPSSSDQVLGKITVSETFKTTTSGKPKISESTVYAWSRGFAVKASGDVTLDKSNFKATIGNEELVFLGFLDREKSKSEKEQGNRGLYLKDTIQLKESSGWENVLPFFRVSQEQYTAGGTMNATIMNEGKSYTVSATVPAGRM